MVTVSNLVPNTAYYFRIKATNATGKSVTSDIFTFKTAKDMETLEINAATLTLQSNHVTLSSDHYKNIVLPANSVVHIALSFPHPEILESLTAEFKRVDVLGASTTDTVNNGRFIETTPGVLSARMQVPSLLTKYHMVFVMETKNGTYLTQSSPYDFYVSKPISVIDSRSDKGIEGAKVSIYRFEESYGTYTLVDQSIEYPSTTDYTGTIPVILPSGKYKIEASATGYPKVTKEIDLGNKDLEYPTLVLERSYSLTAIFQSVGESIQRNAAKFKKHLTNFGRSSQSLRASIALVCLMELILLISFYISTRKHKPHSSSLGRWFAQFVIANTLLLICIFEFLIAIIFLIFQGFVAALPLIALFVLNTYIILRVLRYEWHEYEE